MLLWNREEKICESQKIKIGSPIRVYFQDGEDYFNHETVVESIRYSETERGAERTITTKTLEGAYIIIVQKGWKYANRG